MAKETPQETRYAVVHNQYRCVDWYTLEEISKLTDIDYVLSEIAPKKILSQNLENTLPDNPIKE